MNRALRLLALLLGAGLLALAARRLVMPPGPVALDATGAWADDGWSRPAVAAYLGATGFAALGVVRVGGARRLLALGLLVAAALALAASAASLDLVGLWFGPAVAAVAAPLALIVADERPAAARHALAALLLGGLAVGVLASACLALTALAGSTHLLDVGFLVVRYEDAAPFALTAIRSAAVAVAVLAAWAPFHLGLPELWGEGSAPFAGWLAVVWPWAGWSVLVRLSGGVAPALAEWHFDGATAVTLFLVLGALLPGAAALAERRAGRVLALLGAGALSELLLTVHATGVDAPRLATGLWGYTLAWVCGAAALAGARSRTGDDRLATLSGLAARAPRTALALATAALLWAGLPGTFTLLARGAVWQDAPGGLGLEVSPLALFAVAVGGLLRIFAVARLVRVLYLRAPSAERFEPAAPAITGRWGLVFLAALALEFALGVGPEAWRAPFSTLGAVLLGG